MCARVRAFFFITHAMTVVFGADVVRKNVDSKNEISARMCMRMRVCVYRARDTRCGSLPTFVPLLLCQKEKKGKALKNKSEDKTRGEGKSALVGDISCVCARYSTYLLQCSI